MLKSLCISVVCIGAFALVWFLWIIPFILEHFVAVMTCMLVFGACFVVYLIALLIDDFRTKSNHG